ncbi:hypothetical protein GCM10022270_15790 [Terriglobus aquaticus]|nr:glycosyltransferase family 47 protein [Terriglobus aquaticus]
MADYNGRTAPQKIFLAAYPNAEAEKVATNLKRVHSCSDGRHPLIDTPEAADLILIGGIGNEMGQEEYVAQTIHQPLIDRFPEKCFTVSYRDTPVLFNRGIYESAQACWWNKGRCVTGSYELSGHHIAAVQCQAATSKDLLFSFTGRMSHPVRRHLLATRFQRADVLLEDTSGFNYWSCAPGDREERERRFAQILARSKFCLCPRGARAGSIRLFELVGAIIDLRAMFAVAEEAIQQDAGHHRRLRVLTRDGDVDLLKTPEAVFLAEPAKDVGQMNFCQSSRTIVGEPQLPSTCGMSSSHSQMSPAAS